MNNRLRLHNELLKFVENVYYQPPENLKLKYPCIIYNRDTDYRMSANNKKYDNGIKQYNLMVVDLDPDSDLFDRIESYFMMIQLNQRYVMDNLYHGSFKLYF